MPRKKEQPQETEFTPGVGLDVGTSFLQVARRKTDDTVVFTGQRDAFFEKTLKMKIQSDNFQKSLDKLGYYYIKKGETFYLVGQNAIDYANEMTVTVLRPLSQGVLSPKNTEAISMLAVIIEDLIGKPLVENEICHYSYPARPSDATFNTIYHRDVIGRILTGIGYKAIPILESEALVYSELSSDEDNWTGMTISFGAGMTNYCISHIGEVVFSSSVAKGGDWIDKQTGDDLNLPETLIQAEKENGIDLENPVTETHECIASYYRHLLEYVAETLEFDLKQPGVKIPAFRGPIPVVISGGTTLAKNFLNVFGKLLTFKEYTEEKKVKRDLPFEIREIRSAGDPLTAVANGAMLVSLSQLS
jgi:hypothetical protein